LKEMGFTTTQSIKALTYANHDIEEAVAYLLEHEGQITNPQNLKQETSSSIPSSPQHTENPAPDLAEDKLCVVCLEFSRNTLIAPCGHLCACFECAESVKTSKQACPMCRGPIDMIYRVYYS